MDRQAATNFVIRELGRHRSRDEVTRALTEHVGCAWDEAQNFVDHVQFEQRTRIAARQSPLLLFFGTTTITTGTALVLFYGSAVAFRLSMHMLPSYNQLALVLTGLAMISGAIIGLWRSIRSMWK